MTQSEPGAVPRRPHHISDIAHLFLQDDGPAVRAVPGATRRYAVAAPGTSPVSAFAGAGLALGSLGPTVLTEDPRLFWSARTYLGADVGNPRLRSEKHEPNRTVWVLNDSTDPSPGAPWIRWNHLGCLGESDLAHLESLASARAFLPSVRTSPDGLVWCLLSSEAGYLGTSYLLGRLVDLLQPGRLDIMIFPDAWSRAGRPGWREALDREESEPRSTDHLQRCSALALRVCGDLPLQLHRVKGNENRTDSFGPGLGGKSLWNRMGAGLTGGQPG